MTTDKDPKEAQKANDEAQAKLNGGESNDPNTTSAGDVKGNNQNVAPKDGEVKVHVDVTKEADKDPSREYPYASHTVGTEGVNATGAGSSASKVASTGNAGNQPIIKPDPNASAEDKVEKEDIRDLQPSKQKAAAKAEEKKLPKDYVVEINGQREEDLDIQEASAKAFEALSYGGATSSAVYRKDNRLATFATEDHHGQKRLAVKPDDGKISDDEADVLNSYHQRIVTGNPK